MPFRSFLEKRKGGKRQRPAHHENTVLSTTQELSTNDKVKEKIISGYFHKYDGLFFFLVCFFFLFFLFQQYLRLFRLFFLSPSSLYLLLQLHTIKKSSCYLIERNSEAPLVVVLLCGRFIFFFFFFLTAPFAPHHPCQDYSFFHLQLCCSVAFCNKTR